MKYYAVTEDPNELFHYGRLGMKWGQHIFGEDKSPAFRNAARKLRATKAKAKAAIVKSSAQRDISRVQRQQNRMQKKVMRDQRRAAKIRSINAANKKKEQTRSNLVNAMATLDQEDSFRKQFNRDFKAAQKAQKYERKMNAYAVKRSLIDQKNDIKTMRKSNKAERKLTKYTQLARKGKLKYGKLTEEQIQKLQDRLNMEQRTRQLGSAEKTTKQLRKEALRAGILEGIRKGTSGAMEEVARGIVRNKMANRRVLDKQSKNQAKRDKEALRIKNRKSVQEMREDFAAEATEASMREGKNVVYNPNSKQNLKRAAKYLKKVENQKLTDKDEHDFQNQLRNAQTQELVDFARETGLLNGQTNVKALLDSGTLTKNYDAYQQTQSQNKKNAYNTFITALRNKYNSDLADYNTKFAKYQTDYAAWLASSKKDGAPTEPKKPELPIELSLSLEQYEKARLLGLLGSGNNGGGKNKKK